MTKTSILILLTTLLLSGCDVDVVTTRGGTIVSNPAGINCRSDSGTCSVKNYERLGNVNDVVIARLTAIPDSGYRFSHWKGCDSSSNLHCRKKLEGDIRIEATFVPITLATPSGNTGALRFVAVGDFGKGNTNQKLVGDAMQRVCDQAGGCNFAIGLGDNIYEGQPQNSYDALFETKFEHPFINVKFPFYMALGNHDNSLIIDGGGNFNHRGEIQVDYSYRTDRFSDKWRMPARYYEHSFPQGAPTPLASFFALDSNPFISAVELNPEYLLLRYSDEQRTWIRQALANSRATWKIAYAHHPFLSNGLHGNAGNYDFLPPLAPRMSGEVYRRWLQANVCGKVDMFVAGHDHEVQVLHSVPECGNTILVVSGAGADPRAFVDRARNPALYLQDNQLGFVISEINGDTMTMKVYSVSQSDGLATLKYQKVFPRRALN
ncbi:MAG: hypothetical protein K0Q68_2177 [Moraxellaceae bacterium]|jgi:hypothetical protein|nr:hypothetical protein [Moraxellaceae bacterium]